ncbi:hypothetical protein JCM15765_23520 [Paradesulfitobacterium aromaticivorans]
MVYKVLLVDDEELERKVLHFTLQNENLPIHILGEAANGREALEQVHTIRPDLIIMDIKMPGINGIEATKQIKAAYPATEVIILTAYNEFSYSQQAIKAQASDYLLKPVMPQQLIRAVKEALDRLAQKDFQPGPAIDLASLEEQVKAGNLEDAKRELSYVLQLLASKELNPSASVIHSFGIRLMVIIVHASLSAGADSTEVTALENNMVRELSHMSSVEGLRCWGEAILDQCIALLVKNRLCGDQVLLRQALDYIKSNHANKITLDQVAAHVHLSPAYLSRLFNKKTGRVFTEYLTQVRLEKAKQRLRIPLETIEQIAAATGFSSSSYFSAVFKKYEGITPSQYRSNQK